MSDVHAKAIDAAVDACWPGYGMPQNLAMRRAIAAFLRASAKTYMGLVAVEMDAIADELEQP